MSIKSVLLLPSAASFVAVAQARAADGSDNQRTNLVEATMIRILDEILPLSCLAAFVTGIVVAAASLLS
jgi:hypothetical protein